MKPKRQHVTTVIIIALFAPPATQVLIAAEQPNIVFILADDQDR